MSRDRATLPHSLGCFTLAAVEDVAPPDTAGRNSEDLGRCCDAGSTFSKLGSDTAWPIVSLMARAPVLLHSKGQPPACRLRDTLIVPVGKPATMLASSSYTTPWECTPKYDFVSRSTQYPVTEGRFVYCIWSTIFFGAGSWEPVGFTRRAPVWPWLRWPQPAPAPNLVVCLARRHDPPLEGKAPAKARMQRVDDDCLTDVHS